MREPLFASKSYFLLFEIIFYFFQDIPEKKEKRYKEVGLAAEKIMTLLAECQRYFRADENSEAWWDYLVNVLESHFL